MRVIAMLWFLWCIRQSHLEESHPVGLRFFFFWCSSFIGITAGNQLFQFLRSFIAVIGYRVLSHRYGHGGRTSDASTFCSARCTPSGCSCYRELVGVVL